MVNNNFSIPIHIDNINLVSPLHFFPPNFSNHGMLGRMKNIAFLLIAKNSEILQWPLDPFS